MTSCDEDVPHIFLAFSFSVSGAQVVTAPFKLLFSTSFFCMGHMRVSSLSCRRLFSVSVPHEHANRCGSVYPSIEHSLTFSVLLAGR